MVNGILFQKDDPIDALLVFDIVVGTSTGGLIALMMVKLGMSVDECIEQYEILSREVFGKPHLIGKRTGGFGTTKYSGRRLRELVVALIKKRENRQAEYKMEDTVSHPNHIWYAGRPRYLGLLADSSIAVRWYVESWRTTTLEPGGEMLSFFVVTGAGNLHLARTMKSVRWRMLREPLPLPRPSSTPCGS